MRRARSKLQVSTFPFLAVLLAAMGSLVFLLLVMDRRAKIVARQKALDAYLASKSEKVDQTTRDEQARRAAWEKKRQEIHEQLSLEERLLQQRLGAIQTDLARIEAQIREHGFSQSELKNRLEKERRELEKKSQLFAQMRLGLTQSAKLETDSEKEIAKLSADLIQLETLLQQLKDRKRNTGPVYSLIPYRGKMGDNRQPIYLECARDSVIFHPDRLELPRSEMEVLRIRQEVQQRGAVLVKPKRDDDSPRVPGPPPTSPNPYILFLVRPDGVETYYKAQSAIKGFDLDFGYEFVDADWVLDFGNGRLAMPATTPLPPIPPPLPGIKPRPPAVALGNPFGSQNGTSGHGGGSSFNLSGLPGNGGPGTGDPTKPGAGLVGQQGNPTTAFAGSGTKPGTGVAGQQGVPPTGFAAPGMKPGGDSIPPAGTAGFPGSGAPGNGFPSAGGTGDVANPMSMAAKNPGPLGASFPAPPGAGGVPEATPGLTGLPVLSGAKNGAGASAEPNSQLPPAALLSLAKSAAEDAQFRKSKDEQEPVNHMSAKPPPLDDGSSPPAVPRLGFAQEPAGEAPQGPQDPLASPLLSGATPEARPKPAPTLGRILGNRDYVITIECFDKAVAVFPSNQVFSTVAGGDQNQVDRALFHTVNQLIARRQATVRPGEPPYRPILRFQVHPEGLRSYYSVYPLFEHTRLPMLRENLDN